MTAMARRSPRSARTEPGQSVTDGEVRGVVLAVEHIPVEFGRPGREDVYVLWLPHLAPEDSASRSGAPVDSIDPAKGTAP